MKEGRRINGRHSEGEIYHNQTSTQAEQRTITPNNTQQKENHEHASTNKDTEKNCIILFVSIYQILSILFDCFDLLPCMADEEMTSDCVGLPHKGLRHIPAIQNRFMMNTLTVVIRMDVAAAFSAAACNCNCCAESLRVARSRPATVISVPVPRKQKATA